MREAHRQLHSLTRLTLSNAMDRHQTPARVKTEILKVVAQDISEVTIVDDAAGKVVLRYTDIGVIKFKVADGKATCTVMCLPDQVTTATERLRSSFDDLKTRFKSSIKADKRESESDAAIDVQRGKARLAALKTAKRNPPRFSFSKARRDKDGRKAA